MKFTIAAVLALVSVAAAYSPSERPQGLSSLSNTHLTELTLTLPSSTGFVKRQATGQNAVDVGAPAMTDRNGNVIPFRADAVYQDALAKGI